jgi:glycosyltransferase involved in cell wall biosynthesis
LITPSAEVAELLVDDGIAPARITVIGEGSDHLPAPDHAALDHLLAERGVDGPFVLTVSTLEPRKNLDRLVVAHAAASPRLEGLPLVVVGPEGWGNFHTGSEKVVLVGRQPGAVLAALYERCRAFAYVPITEGFGLPPLEAMAHGAVVIVSSTVPSTRTAAGVLSVDPMDTEAIAAAIARAVADTSSRALATREGRAFAAAHRWSDVAREHLELWEHLS